MTMADGTAVFIFFNGRAHSPRAGLIRLFSVASCHWKNNVPDRTKQQETSLKLAAFTAFFFKLMMTMNKNKGR
jgi:hypothetical protein